MRERRVVRIGKTSVQTVFGLANAVISIVRLKGHFPHMPQASRHCAARQGDALQEITRPG